MSRSLSGRVFAMAAEKFAAGGFQKRQSGIFTRSINNDVIGWAGLNRAVEASGEALRVNPMVGVRHQNLNP